MKEELTLKRKSGINLKMPALAFFITALCFMFMVVVSGKYPFGKNTALISDLDAQYAPYLFLLKNKLQNLGEGRFGYSFLLGAGKNFMGTFGYYLASPLNLLVLLFDATQVNEFVLLLMCLKVSFAATFMCMFIEERAEKKGTYYPVLWGIMYANSSYVMLFLFQIMWLDGYLLLPLLLLMIERYLRNGRLGGVTAVLFLLFWSNYYIAYMAGIYSFLYLLGRMFLLGRFKKELKPLKVIGRFILRAVLTALSLGALLIPVGLDTIRNGDPIRSTGDPSYVGFTFANFLDRIFLGYGGEFNDVLPNNMPLIYVSLLVTFLCVLFFVSRAFSGKAKRFYAAAFILVYLVLCIDFLDIAWQVFDSPNWFWHRESFVFITMFLTVSYKVFENLSKVTKEEIYKTAGILAVLLLLAQSFGEMKDHGLLFIFNLSIIAVITLILIGIKKDNWSGQFKDMGKMLPVILVVCTIYEVSFLTPMQSGGISTLSLSSGESEKVISNMTLLEDYSEASRLLGNGFRADYEEFYNEDNIRVSGISQYMNIPGITIFNSNSNKVFNRFLKQLGFMVNYNYFTSDHSFSAPDTDAFFSMGTVYSTDPDYTGADRIVENDELSFYQNRSVLPLAFGVNRGALDFDFYSLEKENEHKDYFAFRNEWFRSMFNCFTEDYLIPISDEYISVEILNGSDININDYQRGVENGADLQVSKYDDPDILGEEFTDHCSQSTIYRNNSSIPIIINYTIDITSSDEMYMCLAFPRVNKGSEVYLNGMMVAYFSENTYYSSIVRLGAHEIGESVQVTIMADIPEWSYMNIDFAYFDQEVFESQFSQIEQSVTLNSAVDGFIDFNIDLDANQIVLTSIPYEDGWSATIDNQEAQIINYQDALIALDPGPGNHSIILSFTPPGLKIGMICSAIGVIGLVILTIIEKKSSKCE